MRWYGYGYGYGMVYDIGRGSLDGVSGTSLLVARLLTNENE